MPLCYHCGDEIKGKGNVCDKCNQTYCDTHKEPEVHECELVSGTTEVSKYQQINPILLSEQLEKDGIDTSFIQGPPAGTFSWLEKENMVPENAFDMSSGYEFKGIFLVNKPTRIHLLIGTALIFFIGLLQFIHIDFLTGLADENLALAYGIFILAALFAMVWLFHELAHLIVAKHYGLTVKFRLLTLGVVGLVLLLILGILPLVNIPTVPAPILPGVVVILGLEESEKRDNRAGLCKVAGPIVNLAFGAILLIISFLLPMDNGMWRFNIYLGILATMSLLLGLFNMIPIGVFDGKTILDWNKKIYLGLIIAFAALITLFYLNYFVVGFSMYYPEDTIDLIKFELKPVST